MTVFTFSSFMKKNKPKGRNGLRWYSMALNWMGSDDTLEVKGRSEEMNQTQAAHLICLGETCISYLMILLLIDTYRGSGEKKTRHKSKSAST